MSHLRGNVRMYLLGNFCQNVSKTFSDVDIRMDFVGVSDELMFWKNRKNVLWQMSHWYGIFSYQKQIGTTCCKYHFLGLNQIDAIPSTVRDWDSEAKWWIWKKKGLLQTLHLSGNLTKVLTSNCESISRKIWWILW